MKEGIKITALLIAVFISATLIGQNSKNDSLKISEMISVSEEIRLSHPDSALNLANEAVDLSKKHGLYLQTRAIINLAIIYQEASDYKKSSHYFIDGISMAEKIKDKKLMCQAYNSFANLFSLQRQFSQATEYYQRALELAKDMKDTLKTAVISMNVANILYNESYANNDFTKTNKAYAEALYWGQLAKNIEIQISILSNWGMSYSDEQQYQLSIEKLNQALDLAKTLEHQTDFAFIYHYLGRTYSLMKEYAKAIEKFKESLVYAKKYKDLEFEAENYFYLATSNYALQNYKEAYDFMDTYRNLNDTLIDKEISNELNAIKIKFDTEKKQQEIELLKSKAYQDQIIKISLLIGTALLILLGFLLLNRYRLKVKTNILLEQQNQIISEKNKDISDSINYAKRIQEAILPNTDELFTIFPNHFILSMPKDVVSGDFYWAAEVNKLKIFVVADCTGHGVPGAFMSMIGNTLLNQIVIERKITQPDKILNLLKQEIILALKQNDSSRNKDGMDMSLICFNPENNLLQISCANNPVWIIKKNGDFTEIAADKQPIGFVSDEQSDFTLKEYMVNPGDTVYQFSDGYADQFGGEKGKKYKYNQLKQTLINHQNLNLAEQKEMLLTNFTEWKGLLAQIDDVLVSGIRF